MVQEDAKAQVQQSSLLSPWYNYVLTHCKESMSGYDGSSQLGQALKIDTCSDTGSNREDGKHHNSLLRMTNSRAVSTVTLRSS